MVIVEHIFAQRELLVPGLSSGIYPYVGGSVGADELRAAVHLCGGAVTSGVKGAAILLNANITGVLLDPAEYYHDSDDLRPKLFPESDWQDWLERQRAAQVPVILTDGRHIGRQNRAALQRELQRWDGIPEPTLVVLPVGTWWLRHGLAWLIEDVVAAARPVALVLMHPHNGLEEPGTVVGLRTFVESVDVPVVLLRIGMAGVGIGCYATFVGVSAATRCGPIPIYRKVDPGKGSAPDRDRYPGVFVPALHDYVRASKLPALARSHDDSLLRCHDAECRGQSLLRLAEAAETTPAEARRRAYLHNMACHEHVSYEIFRSADWRDAWWQRCKSGADVAATVAQIGVDLPVSGWLSQWIELGPPTYSTGIGR